MLRLKLIYFWEHVQAASPGFPGGNTVNFSMEDISMFNAIGGNAATSDTAPDAMPSGFIATGQGFGIKANSAGTAVFNNAMRLTNNNGTVRNVEENINRLWLEIRNDNYQLQSSTLIGFTQNASTGFKKLKAVFLINKIKKPLYSFSTMKKLFLLVLVASVVISFFWFTQKGETIKNTALTYVIPPSYVHKEGMTIKDRITIPEGYNQVQTTAKSFEEYILNHFLKPANAAVINYDGEPYMYQQGHVGVLELSVPTNGLQQCADALMRLRAEYLWKYNKKETIGFNFTSGHYCSWKQYAKGFRPKVKGNKVSFHKTAQANSSKQNFYKFLNLIYTYAGTQSLYTELPKVKQISDLKIGDMLIKPGSPGHVIMIANICQDAQGNRLFTLLQGNTPAQSVHLLKNPKDTAISPWFTLEIGEPLQIPTYYFEEAKFMRFK